MSRKPKQNAAALWSLIQQHRAAFDVGSLLTRLNALHRAMLRDDAAAQKGIRQRSPCAIEAHRETVAETIEFLKGVQHMLELGLFDVRAELHGAMPPGSSRKQ